MNLTTKDNWTDWAGYCLAAITIAFFVWCGCSDAPHRREWQNQQATKGQETMTTFTGKTDRARAAYVHARAKHPRFPMVITDRSGADCARDCKMAIEWNTSHYETVTAEHILNEEVCEIMDAYVNGTRQQALNEIYDAIAVLYRMADKVEQAMEEEGNGR